MVSFQLINFLSLGDIMGVVEARTLLSHLVHLISCKLQRAVFELWAALDTQGTLGSVKLRSSMGPKSGETVKQKLAQRYWELRAQVRAVTGRKIVFQSPKRPVSVTTPMHV